MSDKSQIFFNVAVGKPMNRYSLSRLQWKEMTIDLPEADKTPLAAPPVTFPFF